MRVGSQYRYLGCRRPLECCTEVPCATVVKTTLFSNLLVSESVPLSMSIEEPRLSCVDGDRNAIRPPTSSGPVGPAMRWACPTTRVLYARARSPRGRPCSPETCDRIVRTSPASIRPNADSFARTPALHSSSGSSGDNVAESSRYEYGTRAIFGERMEYGAAVTIVPRGSTSAASCNVRPVDDLA